MQESCIILASSVISRFRYMLRQMKNLVGMAGVATLLQGFALLGPEQGCLQTTLFVSRMFRQHPRGEFFIAPLHFSSRLRLPAKSSLPFNPSSKISHGVYTFSAPKILGTSLASSSGRH